MENFMWHAGKFPRCFYDKIINFTEFSVTKTAQWIIIACCAYCFRIDYKQRLVLVLFLWLKPNSRTQANEIRDVQAGCIQMDPFVFTEWKMQCCRDKERHCNKKTLMFSFRT